MADLMTNAQLAQLINDALARWNSREAEQYAWVSGSATGGPNGDGRFPLSNGSGETSLIDSPAKLADTVNGPAGLAVAARDAAQGFRDDAQSAASAASTDKTFANNHRLEALSARDLALLYRDQTAALHAAVSSWHTSVGVSQAAIAANLVLTEGFRDEAEGFRDEALASKVAAEAAAALAATFDPNNYYTKTASDGRFVQLTGFTWAALSGKPSLFPPEAHGHVIADVSGLQAALDAKADGSHSHTAIYSTTGDVNGGLQNWNATDRADINPDTSYWYGIRVGHGSAETYYSATLALSFFSDDFKFRRKAAGVDQTWRTIWHDGNFTPASKSDVGHTHIIGNVTGLQDALNDKVTRSNTGVRFGVLPYKAALWVNDGSDGTGIGGWARSFAIQAGSNSTHGGFFTAYGGDTQAAEVRIGVGTVDTSYTQSNALCISSTGMTWANNAVWHGGNFDPNSKLNTSGGAMNGTLTMSSSPIVMSFSGSLPYLDMQTTGVSGGRNYRIRSGIEGVSNAGFSIRDLSNGSNPLYIYDNGVVTTPGGIWSNHIGYNPAGDGFTLGNGWVANYGMSLGEHGGNGTGLATVLSGYSGLRLVTQAATRVHINTSGQVGVGISPDSRFQVYDPTGAGLRVAFAGGTTNYFDGNEQLFRTVSGDPLIHLGPTFTFAYKDIFALSGNIFVRENPSGAGSGMRLHHNGGGAYIDFDGDLNFRTGEGAGLVGISSAGGIVAAGITSTGDLRVGGYTSATGFTMLNNGTLSNPGYLAWYAPGGTRVGYMGWASGNDIVYQAEAGWGLRFNTSLVIGSTTLNGLSGTNTFNGFNNFVSAGNPQTSANPALQAYGADNSSGAWMAFHRPGQYAINMGLDSSNVFRIGGWSADANLFKLDMSGNLSVLGTLRGKGVYHLQSYGGSSAMGAYVSYKDNTDAEVGWMGYGENTTRMRVRNTVGEVMLHAAGINLYNDVAGGQTRIQNSSGYVDIGSINASWCHFNTDRPAFYFAQAAHFDGAPMRYAQGALLHHDSTAMTSGKITTSTSAPSGGSDGDVWFKVA